MNEEGYYEVGDRGSFYLNDTKYNKQAYIWQKIAQKRKERIQKLKAEIKRRGKFQIFIKWMGTLRKLRIQQAKYRYTTKEFQDRFLKIKNYKDLKYQINNLLMYHEKDLRSKRKRHNLADIIIKIIIEYKKKRSKK